MRLPDSGMPGDSRADSFAHIVLAHEGKADVTDMEKNGSVELVGIVRLPDVSVLSNCGRREHSGSQRGF